MPFDPESFARALLAEVLFYDAEFGVAGSVSLIDPEAGRERFVAGYDAARGAYLIEEATAWEPAPGDDDDEDDLGYALAADTEIHLECATNQEAAGALLALAREHGLEPGFMPEFDEEA